MFSFIGHVCRHVSSHQEITLTIYHIRHVCHIVRISFHESFDSFVRRLWPASCGKFAEIPPDLYKKYVHRRLDYFLRDNSNCFHCTSQAATFENQFWTGFDLIRFSSTIFNKFQPFDIFRSHVSSITERSKDTKHFTVMFVGTRN